MSTSLPHEPESGTWVEAGQDGDALRVRKVRLAVLDGPAAGRSVVLAKSPIVIGRSDGDLALGDRKVSALHAELRLEESGYRLRDLGSTNGTFVMGLRVLDAYLHPGAVIGLGDSAVRFEPLDGSVALPLSDATQLGELIGASPPMRRLYREIEKVAPTDMAALVTGETGTGKELVAGALHELSPRARGPFVVLDCASISRSLFAAELFGYEAGAFTGALEQHRGALERADGGTLFLDELAEIPLDMQASLLRAIETRGFRRLGGDEMRQSDFRVVAATNRDLREEVNRQTFRADLYFRVAVAVLEVPPLRARGEDVTLLADHFRREHGAAPFPEGFLDWAKAHAWPGNVRELGHAVSRACLLGSVPGAPATASDDDALAIDLGVPFRDAKARLVEAFERRYLAALLEAHEHNLAAAARAAKLDRMSIYKMLDRLGIAREGT
ncbi:MAG: sigma 54-dependent Fis family transcriptional regulator [Sandaracinaceae bacterium]|nr:sigma 54-dependent Fis family transcriptional regulator [Sandaracinaceae bacterium]